MDISVLQLVLICLYLVFYTLESRSSETLFLYAGAPVIGGFITGLICNNVAVGLTVGATLQLMSLGVAEFGGVSIPDYHVGAVVGTMVCAMTGKDLEFALTIAIPVAMLMVQLDVLARMLIAFFINQSRRYAADLQVNRAYMWIVLGIIPYILRHLIPILIVYFVGGDAINVVLNALPTSIMGAFTVAGKILPAMGVAILLRYMSVKENIAYILIGFVAVAYINISILGVAILAVSLAIIYYKRVSKSAGAVVTGGMDNDEI